jgi:hypothetical integral membrane protein (TIGR02206 family)
VRQFSDPHLAALAVLAVTATAAVWAPRRHPGRWIRYAAWAVSLVIFAAWIGEYVADAVNGTWSAEYTLPLQLTDWVSACSILALWTRRQLLVELTYFWALTATLQAVLTPDLGQNFPSIYYFTYFGYHLGAIVAGLLLVLGCRQYPRPRAAWRVFALTLVAAAVAGIADAITNGNYMYLHYKPAHNSLLNVLGPWPLYIASTALLGLAMLLFVGWLTPTARAQV